jgi:hypothetical protein
LLFLQTLDRHHGESCHNERPLLLDRRNLSKIANWKTARCSSTLFWW